MVIAGASIASLSLTLETIIGQPGVQLKYVNVVYNPKVIDDVPQLASLFGFTTTVTHAEQYWSK